MFKRLLISLVVFSLCLTSWIVPICGADTQPEYWTGLAPKDAIGVPSLFDVEPDFFDDYLDFISNESVGNSRSIYSGIPDEIDLSTDSSFPPIGNQLDTASCASFSSTYYQFTYAKNELMQLSAESVSNRCSPAWTHSYLNQGQYGVFTYMQDNYNVLKTVGAVSCSVAPINSNTAFTNWTTNTQARRDALNVRLEGYYADTINTASYPISSYDDSDLFAIKYLLYSGYLLSVSTKVTPSADNYTYGTSSEFGEIVYRASDAGSGHALTIVGYNDWVCYDINDNGIIEDSEYGAFKIANSWGTDWGNDGYIWVMYDALNVTTQISGAWENSLTGTRKAIFDFGSTNGNNVFYYIRVTDKKPMFVGEITINTGNRSAFRPTFISVLKDGSGDETSSTLTSPYGSSNGANAYNGTILLAFNEQPIQSVDTDKSLHTYFSAWMADNATATISYRITDDHGNIIYQHKDESNNTSWVISGSSQLNVNKTFSLFYRGDVNFDGVISSEDAQLVLRNYTNTENLSNAQIYYGDYNRDGVLSSNDAMLILQNTTE